VVAASVDPREDAEKIVADQKITYPIGYGLDPEEIVKATGAFYDAEDEEPYLHATAYVVDPEGVIQNALYSTGSLGRFTADDALRVASRISK